jgi:hypothetical protein
MLSNINSDQWRDKQISNDLERIDLELKEMEFKITSPWKYSEETGRFLAIMSRYDSDYIFPLDTNLGNY